MVTRREHREAALRAMSGVRPGINAGTVRKVADLLKIGQPKEIEARGWLRRVLTEHTDLLEVEEHLTRISGLYLTGDEVG